MDHSDDISIPDSCKPPKKNRFLQVSRGRTGLGFNIAAQLTIEKTIRHLYLLLSSFISSAFRTHQKKGKRCLELGFRKSGFADHHNSWMGLLTYLTTLITYFTPVHIHSTVPTIGLAAPADVSTTTRLNQLIRSDFTVLLFIHKSLSNFNLDPLCDCID